MFVITFEKMEYIFYNNQMKIKPYCKSQCHNLYDKKKICLSPLYFTYTNKQDLRLRLAYLLDHPK